MKKTIPVLLAFLLVACLPGFTQKVIYSEPDRDDARVLNFEILGKMNNQVLIYKNYRDQHFISRYDLNLKLIEKSRLGFFPDRVLNTEFIQYTDFSYVIYQYQKKNMLYCMAAKLNSDGKIVGEPKQLDTTGNINYAATNRIYSVIFSEDKQKIMVFKINSRNDRAHVVTTSLFDKNLELLRKSRLTVSMPQRNDFLSEFSLDNEGDLACIRASGTSQNDNINKITLITKRALNDSFSITDLKLNGLFLDDLRIKADNVNKHYIITSFFSKKRRGDIEGLYYYLWDKEQNKEILTAATVLSDEFRVDAKGDGNIKAAFNDFFLKNIILRKDGGFLVVSESAYTTSRGNTLNRWDYLYGSPYWAQTDYYAWNSPAGFYPWWRSNSFNTTLTRYFADNLAVISFDPSGKMEWSNVIRKAQYDDNSDNFIGYGLLNTGNQLHFLFNVQEKREMTLSDQSLSPGGQINRNPTFKNLERGYDFMPRHAKQIGARQMIIPCQYRGYTCFAKIDF